MDPYRLYHALDEEYRPLGGGGPLPPRYPQRVKALVYGFAMQAEDEEIKKVKAMAGGRVS